MCIASLFNCRFINSHHTNKILHFLSPSLCCISSANVPVTLLGYRTGRSSSQFRHVSLTILMRRHFRLKFQLPQLQLQLVHWVSWHTHPSMGQKRGWRGSSTCVLVRGETFHFRFASRWAKARFNLAIIGYFNKPICCFLLALNANRNWNAANAPTTAATLPSPSPHPSVAECVCETMWGASTWLSSAQLNLLNILKNLSRHKSAPGHVNPIFIFTFVRIQTMFRVWCSPPPPPPHWSSL